MDGWNSLNLCSLNHAPTCVFAPGVIGLLKLFRSQIYISESFAPDARRLLWGRKNWETLITCTTVPGKYSVLSEDFDYRHLPEKGWNQVLEWVLCVYQTFPLRHLLRRSLWPLDYIQLKCHFHCHQQVSRQCHLLPFQNSPIRYYATYGIWEV